MWVRLITWPGTVHKQLSHQNLHLHILASIFFSIAIRSFIKPKTSKYYDICSSYFSSLSCATKYIGPLYACGLAFDELSGYFSSEGPTWPMSWKLYRVALHIEHLWVEGWVRARVKRRSFRVRKKNLIW